MITRECRRQHGNQLDDASSINDSTEWTYTASSNAAATFSSADEPLTPSFTLKRSTSILDDPRLSFFMERANYESNVDPYRGLFPDFASSFNSREVHESKESGDRLVPGKRVLVNVSRQAVIVSIDDDPTTALVRWMTTTERVPIDSITVSEPDTQENVDDLEFERRSPWSHCSSALNRSNQKFSRCLRHDADAVVNDDDCSPSGIYQEGGWVVQCGCPTVDQWATDELNIHETELAAASNKKGKKNRRGKKNRLKCKSNHDVEVMDIDEVFDDDDMEVQDAMKLTPCEPLNSIIICGRRHQDSSCPCDSNPFCLASLGGVIDEYRYNIARTKLLLSNSSDSIQSNEVFASTMTQYWSDLPTIKNTKKSGDILLSNDDKFGTRSSIVIERDVVAAHVSACVCPSNGSTNYIVDELMGTIENHHKSLIMPSTLIPLSPEKIQLSKPSGLKHLAATCYLSSQLQCLAQNIGFVHGLMSWMPSSVGTSGANSSEERMHSVLSSMQSILARVRFGHENTICTNDFASALGIENDEMQDPNELAGLLFNRIQDSFNHSAGLEKLLPSIFCGKSVIEIVCSECKQISANIDDFECVPIPIIDNPIHSKKSRGEDISNDVDVQQLLDCSFVPELLDGDNQYHCYQCNKKCDAWRCKKFNRLPPVLNIQLNRYVSDRLTESKQKLSTHVLLPHTLEVPSYEGTMAYNLVAVQNHLGESAHGGHYIANVLEWCTGVWYECNDDEVNVLDQGPLSSYYTDLCQGIKTSHVRRKINGSSDAYNLIYVEKNHFSKLARDELVRLQEGNTTSSMDGSIICSNNLYQSLSRDRREHYKLKQEHLETIFKEDCRLKIRKEQIIKELLIPELIPDDFILMNNFVLVESKLLRRFFSCTDGLKDIFRTSSGGSILNARSILCDHTAGIHPRSAALCKALSKEAYEVFSRILKQEMDVFLGDESESYSEALNGTPLISTAIQDRSTCGTLFGDVRNDVVCRECSIPYQLNLMKKFKTLKDLIDISVDLQDGINDIDAPNVTFDVSVICRSFVTSFRTYVERKVESILNSKESDFFLPGGDLCHVDFGRITTRGNDDNKGIDSGNAFTNTEVLDMKVNSKITCIHGRCNIMHNRKSSRLIPTTLWLKLIAIFPDAIHHEFTPFAKGSNGNCRECYLEKVADEQFQVKLKEWRDDLSRNPTLLKILNGEYDPKAACSNITFGLPHNGWAVQLGVHKIVCSPPGLMVTTDIHRRSNPVQPKHIDINGSPKELILTPNSYVEILETRVHGGRVRGRIAWEEDGIESLGKRKKTRRFRRKKGKGGMNLSGVHYGWISLQRAEEDESTLEEPGSNRGTGDTDGDEGPWTEPIPLGVYRIYFGAGLPLRRTPERDSTLLANLEKGQCVEVVETRIGGDRVRARCIVPGNGSGWISLLNAVTGAKGARPVPLGAYVAKAESGCVVTEGDRLDSRVKGKLEAGTCFEVVATRIEEGVVRGLIAAGGYVSLFCPSEREEARMFAMPVPLGTYQVIQNGLEVTTGISSSSPICVELEMDACAEIIETRVEDGRVRGRMVAVGYGGVSKEASGWINLFEPTCRWAKIVCFQGGRPISP